MSFARDICEPILRDIAGGLGSMFGLNLSDVLRAPAEYSPATTAMMQQISTSAVMPVASAILVVLFMIELTRVGVRTDGDGELFARVAFFTLVKFLILRMLFESTGLIMRGIYSLFTGIAKATNVTLTNKTSVADGALDPFLDGIDQLGMLEQAVLIILLILAWIVNKVAVMLALAIVVMRFIKLWVFSAWAPVPIAFLAEQESRQIGIGFLRNYGATVTQAFVLVIAFAIYQTMTQGWANQAFSKLDGNTMTAALSASSSFIFMGILMGMIILGSGRIANELFGN